MRSPTHEKRRRTIQNDGADQSCVAAFEQDDGSYVVRRLPVERYAELLTPSRSNSVSAHRVGMVKRAVFEGEGEVVAVVRP